MRLSFLHGVRAPGIPVAHLSLGGQRILVALDTGSPFVLSQQALAGLQPGASMDVELEGWGRLPEMFGSTRRLDGELGRLLSGLVPPQLLARSGEAVVLSIRDGILVRAPAVEAERELRSRGPVVEGDTSCAQWRGGVPERAYLLVEGAVSGVPVRWLLDTGSDETVLYREAAAAAHVLTGKEPSVDRVTLTGSYRGALVERARLDVGPWGFDLPLVVGSVPSRPPCEHDGLLGTDVLRACQLAATRGWFMLRCTPDGLAGAGVEDGTLAR